MLHSLRTLLTVTALLSGAAALAHEGAAPPAPATALTISGAVEKTLSLRPEELRLAPAGQIGELQLPGRGGAEDASRSQVRGVRLRDLLQRAGIVQRDHNTVKKLALIATGSDGYAVVFSWNELFNSEAGETVLVLFERDGKPLGAAEGPLALIAGKDLRAGPRHVKWLRSVEVRQIVE